MFNSVKISQLPLFTEPLRLNSEIIINREGRTFRAYLSSVETFADYLTSGEAQGEINPWVTDIDTKSIGLFSIPTTSLFGTNNFFAGDGAGQQSTSQATDNVFIGFQTGFANTAGRNNVFIGRSSGAVNTAGSNNIYIGRLTGTNNLVGSNNILLGNGTNTTISSISGAIALGLGVQVSQNYQLALSTANVSIVSQSNTINFGTPEKENNINVIGTTTTQDLIVTGNTSLPDISSLTVNNLTITESISSNGYHIFQADSASDAVRITQTGTGNALVVEDSANPDSTPFVVTNSGNVGIGTLTPIAALDVEGSVRAQTITTTQTNVLCAQHPTGSLVPYRIIQQDGEGRINHTLNVTGNDNPNAGVYAADRDPALRLTMSGTGFTFATAPTGMSGQPITWITGLFNSLSGNIGIGTTTPNATLDILSRQPSGTQAPFRGGVLVSSEGSDIGGRFVARAASLTVSPGLICYRSRGSLTAPTSILTDDSIATFSGIGYDGANWVEGGSIVIRASNIWESINRGTHIRFNTTGGNFPIAERMRITNLGNVGIGTTTPIERLTVVGNISASGQLQVGGTVFSTPSAADNTGVYFRSFPLVERGLMGVGNRANNVTDIDVKAGNIWFFNQPSTASWVHNIRASSTVPLSSVMGVGDTIVVSVFSRQTSFNFYTTACKVDGLDYNVFWYTGVVPPSGSTVTGYDVYTWTIVKVASADTIFTPTQFVVFGMQTRYG